MRILAGQEFASAGRVAALAVALLAGGYVIIRRVTV